MNLERNRPPLALRSIALFEIIKGALAVAAACGLLSLRQTDLHAAADAFLLRHGIDPERHFTRLFIESMAKLTNHHIGQIVAFAFVYAIVRFAEGYGLWHAKKWAEWFAVISAGLYLPLELRHMFPNPTPLSTGVTLLNFVLLIYLIKLLAHQRSKKHHDKPSTEPEPVSKL